MRFLHISEFENSIAKTLIIPYVLEGFFGLLLQKCSKNVGNSCVFDKEKLIAKNLIIPYVLEGF